MPSGTCTTNADRAETQASAILAATTPDDVFAVASGETVAATDIIGVPVEVLGHVVNRTRRPDEYRHADYAVVYVRRRDDGRVLAVRVGGRRAMEQLGMWKGRIPYSAVLTVATTGNGREMQVWRRTP